MRLGDAVILPDGRHGTVTGVDYWSETCEPLVMVQVHDGEPGFAKYELERERDLVICDAVPPPDFLDLVTEPEYAEAVTALRRLRA